MKLHELKSPAGARTARKRVGRGTGSGLGKTAGRGQKGQKARGSGFRHGFEGGQMPLKQRLPKLGGFKNRFKVEYAVVNLTRLSQFPDDSIVTPELLAELGMLKTAQPLKVLGAGVLRRRLTVRAHAFSEAARAAIVARGGTAALIEAGEAAAPAPESPA